jgi:hypothetical protein
MNFGMLTRRINVKPVIAVPKGSILPGTLEIPVITEGTFLEKMYANLDHRIAIVVLTTEELIVLVEKPHLFGIDVIALVGVPGGRYDAVWSSYVAPLKRISLDTLSAEVKKILEVTEVDSTKAAHSPRVPDDLVRVALDEPETFE